MRRKMQDDNEELMVKQMEEDTKERWDNLSNEDEAVNEE